MNACAKTPTEPTGAGMQWARWVLWLAWLCAAFAFCWGMRPSYLELRITSAFPDTFMALQVINGPPGFLQDTIYGQFLPNTFTLIDVTLAWLQRVLHCSELNILQIKMVVSFAAFSVGLHFWIRRFSPLTQAAIVGLVFLSGFCTVALGSFPIAIIDRYGLHMTLGMAFSVLALGLAMDGWLVCSAVALGALFNLHIAYFASAGLLVAVIILGQAWGRPGMFATIFKATLGCIVAASPIWLYAFFIDRNLLAGFGASSVSDHDFWAVMQARKAHHILPSLWPRTGLVMYVLTVIGTAVALPQLERRALLPQRTARIWLALLLTGMAMMIVGGVAIEVLHLRIMATLTGFFRVSGLLMLVTAPVLMLAVKSLVDERHWLPLLPVMGGVAMMYYTFPAAGAALAILAGCAGLSVPRYRQKTWLALGITSFAASGAVLALWRAGIIGKPIFALCLVGIGFGLTAAFQKVVDAVSALLEPYLKPAMPVGAMLAIMLGLGWNLRFYHQRFSELDRAWLNVQRWAATNTAPDAKFVHDPNCQGFALFGRRSFFLDWGELGVSIYFPRTFDLELRLASEYGVNMLTWNFRRDGNMGPTFTDNFEQFDEAKLRHLKEAYHVTHAVFPASKKLALAEIYNDHYFAVYEIE